METQKKLFRSRTNRIIAGICGGIGEYLGVDPTVIRLLWIIFIFAGGAGLLAYIVAYFIIPERQRPIEVCPNCGAINPDDSTYCQKCGQKLTKDTEGS
jgi:phage shock protein C